MLAKLEKTHNMVRMTIQEPGRAIGMLHGGMSQRQVSLSIILSSGSRGRFIFLPLIFDVAQVFILFAGCQGFQLAAMDDKALQQKFNQT